MAGRYDNPIPTRCLAPIDFLKIPTQGYPTARQATKAGGIDTLESILGLHKRLKIQAGRELKEELRWAGSFNVLIVPKKQVRGGRVALSKPLV